MHNRGHCPGPPPGPAHYGQYPERNWPVTVRAGRPPLSIDWIELRAAAVAAAGRAYAPYSRLHVGAAGLAADGTVVTGCNVENASFGLTLCAECGLVSALHAAGRDTL